MQKTGDNLMKLIKIVSMLAILLLTGCASVSQQRATVADGTIQNSSLGFFGFTFRIPEGFEVYSPAAKNPAEYNELQRMAIRIYDLNKAYHPRGNELFYESFLLISDQACFLLMTLKYDTMTRIDDSPFSDRVVMNWQLIPFYNVTGSRSYETGRSHQPAVCTRGYAYEKDGWYYADPKRNSFQFSYEACKPAGSNRDSYILIGFALPDNAKALAAPMKQMVEGMEF